MRTTINFLLPPNQGTLAHTVTCKATGLLHIQALLPTHYSHTDRLLEVLSPPVVQFIRHSDRLLEVLSPLVVHLQRWMSSIILIPWVFLFFFLKLDSDHTCNHSRASTQQNVATQLSTNIDARCFDGFKYMLVKARVVNAPNVGIEESFAGAKPCCSNFY